MGTRGSWGFLIDGNRWETYNHFDSYPDGLGDDLLKWGRGVQDWAAVAERVRSLTVVQQDEKPSTLVLRRLLTEGFGNGQVSTGTDWYSALRECQGNPGLTLTSGYWVDGTGFHEDSLFCEWAYLYDLDALDGRGEFVVFEGFQKTGGVRENGMPEYGPVVEVARFPLDRLPESLLGSDGTPDLDEDEGEDRTADRIRRQAAVVAAEPAAQPVRETETIFGEPRTGPDPVDALVAILVPARQRIEEAGEQFDRLIETLPEDPDVPAPGPLTLQQVRQSALETAIGLRVALTDLENALALEEGQDGVSRVAAWAVAAYRDLGGPVDTSAIL